MPRCTFISWIAATIAALSAAANAQTSTPAPIVVHYDFPQQMGQAELSKTDPDHTILTDGKIRSDGPGAVWGKWNTSPVIIDWQFEKPVRIKAIELSLVHTKEDSANAHAERVELFGSASATPTDQEFLEIPDAVQDIPFQQGRTQTVLIPLADKNGGLTCQRLRMRLKAAKYQVVLTEVKFDAVAAQAGDLKQAQQARQDAQPPELQPVQFPPSPIQFPAATGLRHPESIFGFCGHMLHTDEYFGSKEKFSAYWRLEYTLPYVMASEAGWMREPLYGSLFKGDDNATSPNGQTFARNRQLVSRDLNLYDKAGVRIMLCPFLVKPDDADFDRYARWLIQLAKEHPSVAAIEMHNEPNLRGFWKGTPQEYIDTCKAYSKAIKKKLPHMQVIVGSFSGWGHGQYGDTGTNNYGGGGKQSPIALAFAEEVFDSDLLEYADAVSAHPYRNFAAPEGGVELVSPTDPNGFEKEINIWWDLIQKHNKTKRPLKVHFSELGYSVSKVGYAKAPSIERQADYASRLMMILLNTRLSGFPLESVLWYDLKNDENKGEYESNFGLISADLSHLRPGYLAIRRIAQNFATPSQLEQAGVQVRFNNEPENIKSYTWRNTADGSLVVSYWRMNQLQKVDRDFTAAMTLSLLAGKQAQSVELTDLHEDQPRAIGFTASPSGTLSIPVMITARAAWVTIRLK